MAYTANKKNLLNGIKGYEKILEEIKHPGGRKLNRTTGESSGARARSKLTGKRARRTSNHLHNLHRAKVEAQAAKKSLQVAAVSANRVGTVP